MNKCFKLHVLCVLIFVCVCLHYQENQRIFYQLSVAHMTFVSFYFDIKDKCLTFPYYLNLYR